MTAQRGQMGRPNIARPREFLPDLGVWTFFPSVGEVSVCQRCTLPLGFQRSSCRTPKGTPPLTAGIDSSFWRGAVPSHLGPLARDRNPVIQASPGPTPRVSGPLVVHFRPSLLARSLFLSGEPALPASVSLQSPFPVAAAACALPHPRCARLPAAAILEGSGGQRCVSPCSRSSTQHWE